MNAVAPDLAPALADMPDRPGFEIPQVEATAETLQGYGELIDGPDARTVEVVRWPAEGWRPVDPGTGDEAGTTEGNFEFWWAGDVLRARKDAGEVDETQFDEIQTIIDGDDDAADAAREEN